jgi:hypothetical protein
MANQILVSTVHQAVNHLLESGCVSTKSPALNLFEDAMETATNVVAETSVHFSFFLANLLHVHTKDEHVINATLFSNFNVSSVHGTNDKTSIHDKLHV